jgi:hypothetical protein
MHFAASLLPGASKMKSLGDTFFYIQHAVSPLTKRPAFVKTLTTPHAIAQFIAAIYRILANALTQGER